MIRILKAIRDFKAYRKSMKEKALKENQLYFEHSLCSNVLQDMVDKVHKYPNVIIDIKLLSGETLRIHGPLEISQTNSVKKFYNSL